MVCSAARQLHRRFEMDCAIVDRYLPGHLVTEFGGIAGISYSLRQIALIAEIAGDMRRLCPAAWLLVSSNPLPRVCQAAHALGIRTAGFCSVSLEGYSMLWHIWHGVHLAYPFTAARERWDATMAGLNHFVWVTALHDRATGEDLSAELRRRGEGGHRPDPRGATSRGAPPARCWCLTTATPTISCRLRVRPLRALPRHTGVPMSAGRAGRSSRISPRARRRWGKSSATRHGSDQSISWPRWRAARRPASTG